MNAFDQGFIEKLAEFGFNSEESIEALDILRNMETTKSAQAQTPQAVSPMSKAHDILKLIPPEMVNSIAKSIDPGRLQKLFGQYGAMKDTNVPVGKVVGDIQQQMGNLSTDNLANLMGRTYGQSIGPGLSNIVHNVRGQDPDTRNISDLAVNFMSNSIPAAAATVANPNFAKQLNSAKNIAVNETAPQPQNLTPNLAKKVMPNPASKINK